MARGLHGFDVAHGFTHRLFSQARDGGHSRSELHPMSTGSPEHKKNRLSVLLNKIKADLTYQFATLISPPTVSWFASANHDSQRKLILDLTVCILSTWPHMQAWVEAFSVKASMFGWAITISNAPWLFYYRFGN